jgi:hypothetical protein
MTVHGSERHSVVVDNRRTSIRAWQDRFRDRGLTVLLILQLCLVFLAVPLAAKGLPIARPIVETMVLAVVVIVVMLSHRRGAMAAILPGLAAMLASILLGSEWPPVAVSVLRRGGNILTFSPLTLGIVACRLCPWPYHVPPPSRCGRAVSEPRDDLRGGF